VKEADDEAPMVWSRPEVKKIQYGGGGMVLDCLDFWGKGSLGSNLVEFCNTPLFMNPDLVLYLSAKFEVN
jgi:hypothetical protein